MNESDLSLTAIACLAAALALVVAVLLQVKHEKNRSPRRHS